MAVIHYEGRDYTLDVRGVSAAHAIAIGRSGLRVKDLHTMIAAGNLDALRALFWLMLAQNGEAPKRVEDTDFKPAKFMRALAEAS